MTAGELALRRQLVLMQAERNATLGELGESVRMAMAQLEVVAERERLNAEAKRWLAVRVGDVRVS